MRVAAMQSALHLAADRSRPRARLAFFRRWAFCRLPLLGLQVGGRLFPRPDLLHDLLTPRGGVFA